MKKTWKIDKVTIALAIIALIELTSIVLLCKSSEYREQYFNNTIDSLKRDNVIIEDSISFIDSIKNDYVEKNYNLNDSDAIKLFYDLLKR